MPIQIPSSMKVDLRVHRVSASDDSRIRVMRIIDRLVLGGPTKHVLWLEQGLNERDFKSLLVTGSPAKDEFNMIADVASSGIDIFEIPELGREISWGQDLCAFLKLLRLMFVFKPDVVHTHKSKAGALGRIAALCYRWLAPSSLMLKPRKCRVIHTYHGHIFHGYYGRSFSKVIVGIERLLARIATDDLVVVSKQQRDEIVGKFRVGTNRQTRVIPLGLQFTQPGAIRGQFRTEYAISSNQHSIGAAGRLCEIKNYSLLIAAASMLLKTPSFKRRKFFLAGEGHLRARLAEEAHQAGIADSFILLGVCKEMADFYAAMDVVALTSLNEGTPLVLLEAMSCGRPVVSTEVGGVPDIMGERMDRSAHFSIWTHGLTVRSGDAERFARALEFILNRPELRQQMGITASNYVRSRFSTSRLISDIQELYTQTA